MISKPTPRPKIRHPLKSKPKGVNPILREQVLEQYGSICQWCGVMGGRVDLHHVQRRSQGGKDSQGNLRPVHRLCHSYIHDHPAEAKRRGLLV